MDNIRIKQTANAITLSNDLFAYEITRRSGGLPARICLRGQPQPLLNEDRPILRAKVDGRTIYPSLRHGFEPEVCEGERGVKVIFHDIRWEDQAGRPVESYRLALSYEFFPDGAAFVKTFFYTETLTPGTIQEFILEPKVRLGAGDQANWAWWEFPKTNTAKFIQAVQGFGRNLSMRESCEFPKRILPFVSFDFGKNDLRDRHVEFFMESFAPLMPDAIENTQTDVTWSGKTATLTWNFQRTPQTIPHRCYQWRNIWGWTVSKFPVRRTHPPLRLYHYLDNYRHLPSDEVIAQAASQGANLFILHENWRLDVKQGDFPYNHARLKAVIDCIHKHKMRAALYVRGNEADIREDSADNLRPYLKRNWDGLYMDFGTPYGYLTIDEYSPGGRIQFREYYKVMRRLRELVGPQGLLLSHSGSFFAAMAHTLVDAYVAGEQEKGQMIKDKGLHAYFSGLSIAPSSLWTGAFPSYRTKEAVPYLAATAQVPFVMLGTQLETCSLDHPQVPSVVRFQRPLWRIWALLDGKTNVRVYCLQNTTDVFQTDSRDTGACLIVDKDNNALLIATNFSDREHPLELKVNWSKLGLMPKATCLALQANYERCAWQKIPRRPTLSQMVEGFGVAGWLFTGSTGPWHKALKTFTRPYAAFPQAEQGHYDKVEAIRRHRFEPPAWDRCFLRVTIPNFTHCYEESLVADLYDNVVELLDWSNPKRPRRLGYVSKKGLVRKTPAKKDYLQPDEHTPWIALHKLIKPSRGKAVRLALATRRGPGEFYSWLKGELSPSPARNKDTYEITYNNDIDLDWSLLTFDVRLNA